MILFENITKSYNKHVILDDLHFQIEAEDFICLQGPSGAGKTTLVHTLIGAEKPDKGRVIVDDFEVNRIKVRSLQHFRRKLGMVFQDYKLLPQKTVYENIAFPLEVCGYEDKQINKKVNELLKLVGLTKHKRHFPRQLSGGEQQRTAIARALVHDPLLIIADEPTGNLDFDNASEIIKLLIKINQQGTTVLLTTHNHELVKLIPHCRLVNLKSGRITKDVVISSK